MRTQWLLSISLLGVLSVLYVPEGVIAQDLYGAERKKEKKKTEAKPEIIVEKLTHLDEEQLRYLDKLEKMFRTLYDSPKETKIPDQASELLRFTVFRILEGTYMPERERSNQMTNDLAANLVAKELTATDAWLLVKETAETLGKPELSLEHLDSYSREVTKILDTSLLTDTEVAKAREKLEQIIRTAQKNERKIKEREEAKKKEEERLEKERQKKIEEAKKKARRKMGGPGMGSEGF